jgi:hypothetical protein
MQGREPTFKPDSIPLQALHGLLEECLARRRHTRDIVLFPLNGSIDMLEDLLDRVCNFRTNPISGNQSYLGG